MRLQILTIIVFCAQCKINQNVKLDELVLKLLSRQLIYLTEKWYGCLGGDENKDRRLCIAMLRIRDILVRIRIRGSVPLSLTSSSGSGSSSRSYSFCQWPSTCQQKIFFSICLLLFEGAFTSFFKDKMSQKSRNQGFSYYFFWWWEVPDPGGQKIYWSGSGTIVHRFHRMLNLT